MQNLENFTKREEWKRVNLLEQKIDLILDHLELEYEPEKNVKEPAKLEKKAKRWIELTAFADSGGGWVSYPEPEKPKKKKGRPKGSKNKKK